MKKLLMGLSLVALLAGCASQDRDNNGMGGTSDQTYRSDSINNNSGTSSQDSSQFNNNATQGTGTSTATNSATGEKTAP